MSGPRLEASKNELRKSVRAFEKFAALEDLVDTDSESESENESVGRSNAACIRRKTTNDLADFQKENIHRSIVLLYVPKLEGALLDSSAKTKYTDNIEDVVLWVCELTHQSVLECVNRFVDVLIGFTIPTDNSTWAVREFQTNSNSSSIDVSESLTNSLITLLLDSTAAVSPVQPVLPPVINFLLLLLQDRHTEAAALITNLVATLRELTSPTTLSTNGTNNITVVLQHSVTLQYVLKLLQAHVFYTHDTTDNDNTQSPGLSQQLRTFARQYTALFPILGCAVRAAVLHCALCGQGGTNYVLLESLLSQPVSEATLQEAYATLSTIHTASTANPGTRGDTSMATNTTGISNATGGTVNDNVLKVHSVQKETVADEGYMYLQNLSREETIKALYPLPAGSFLLRPHETSASQYFLSFRTVGSTTSSTSTTNNGKNSNGRISPEAAVKHAIIRQTYTVATITTTSSDTSGTSVPSTTSGIADGETGKNSPLPMLQRQPQVYPMHRNKLTPDSSSTVSDSGTNNSVTENNEVKVYSYQCGKIGPCATMTEMLRQISSVLETPLLFTPIITANANTTAASQYTTVPFTSTTTIHSNASSDSTPTIVSDAAGVLDINHALWAHLAVHLNKNTNEDNNTTRTDYGASMLGVKTNTEHTMHDILDNPWQVAAQPEIMHHMFDLLLRTLSVRRYVSQMAADLGLCEKLLQSDITNATQLSAVSGGNDTNNSGRNNILSVYKSLLDTTGPERATFHAWLAPYRHFIHLHEQKLHALLLPSLSLHKWYTPPLERSIHRERTGCNSVVSNTAHNNSAVATVSKQVQYAPEEELLLAEHLISHISACVGTRSVRLSNTAGTEHVTLSQCMPAEEVHRLLTHWWEIYVQHESTVTQRVAARRMSERINSKHAAATVPAKDAAASVDGIVDPNTTSTEPSTATTSLPTNKVISIKEFDQDFKLSSHMDYETSIVSATTTNTTTTLSLALYTILKRIHSLLSIDMTCKAKDYIHTVVAWVSDELQIVYEVIKPGEYAFSAATRYYCPHHPYEVKVLRDYAQASERVRLGRHVFSSTSQTSSSSSSSSGAGNCKLDCKKGSTSSSAYKSKYFQQNVESAICAVNALTSSAVEEDGIMDSRVIEVARLWNLLGAEQYLTSTIAHASELCTREQLPVRYPAPIPDTSSTTTTTTTTTNPSLQVPTLANQAGSSSLVTNHSSHPGVPMPPKESPSEYNSYLGALQRALYHNTLYSRLGFATRTIPIVQVDIYALQEILAVRSMQANSAQAPVAIPSGVSPLTYMNMFNKPTVLTPTASAHGSGALETYTVMRLSHKTNSNNDFSSANNSTLHHALSSMSLSLPTSGTSTPVSKNNNSHVPLSVKHCPIGTVVGSVHKAEARRTPFDHISNTANTISSTHTIAPNWSKAQQQAVARAVEYNFREQALFRFALPEGQLSLYPPANGGSGVTLHPYPEYSKDNSNDTTHVHTNYGASNTTMSSTNAISSTARNASTLPPTTLSIPAQYFEVPSLLTIAVYERSFFSDTLLGELELDLSCIHEKRLIRGWYPLTLEKSISWMVFLQVRLKTQDMSIETNTIASGNGSAISHSSVPSDSSSAGSGILGMVHSIGFRDAGEVTSPTDNSPSIKGSGSVNGFSIFKQMDDF